MATITTYLLVSGADDQEAVQSHPVVDHWNLDVRNTREEHSDQVAGVKLVHESPLEDQDDLTTPAQTLSADFPSATVLLCEVEERFDHIERLQTKMYRKGKNAGNVEHGYIFNVGDH